MFFVATTELGMIVFNTVDSLQNEWDPEFEEARNSIAFVPSEEWF
ncbi:MAG: hypothetical protein WAR83_11265 [Flavobacteriales bacterium]|jgi:hypothetical protein